MEQLFGWAWQGIVIFAIGSIILRVIPVAFDAWKSGNLIVGTVKTVGPVVSVGVLAIGGYMVVNRSLTFIMTDAKQSGFYNEFTRWGNSGAGSFDSAASDVSSYFEGFKSEYGSSAADTGDNSLSEDTTEQQSSAGSQSLTDIQVAPQSNVAAPAVRSNEVAPVTAPTRVVGVHAAQMDTTNVLTPDEVQSMAEYNAKLGEQARNAAAESGDSSSLNGNSEMMMFGGGGGLTTLQADQAVTTVDGGVYVVKRGDDLTKISVAVYGSKNHAMTICKANQLRNCDVVAVGKRLVIPAIAQ